MYMRENVRTETPTQNSIKENYLSNEKLNKNVLSCKKTPVINRVLYFTNILAPAVD